MKKPSKLLRSLIRRANRPNRPSWLDGPAPKVVLVNGIPCRRQGSVYEPAAGLDLLAA